MGAHTEQPSRGKGRGPGEKDPFPRDGALPGSVIVFVHQDEEEEKQTRNCWRKMSRVLKKGLAGQLVSIGLYT